VYDFIIIYLFTVHVYRVVLWIPENITHFVYNAMQIVNLVQQWLIKNYVRPVKMAT